MIGSYTLIKTIHKFLLACDGSVNDVIADKNIVTKIMNNSTGLERIELNGFAKCHLANRLLPICIWMVFRPMLRPRLVPVVYRFGVLTHPCNVLCKPCGS